MIDNGAVLEAIRSGLETETGRPWGDNAAPSNNTPVYGIMYTIPGGGPDSTAIATLDHGGTRDILTIQLKSVGRDTEGARWLQHQARLALRDTSNFSMPSGTRLELVTLDLPGGEPRDDDLGTVPLFYADDRFRLFVVPAA